MKKISTLLFVLILLFGCKKNSGSSGVTYDIAGTYPSTDPLTNTTSPDGVVNVSVVNSTYIKITYNRSPYDPQTLFVFDSVKIFNDKTFTLNQIFQAPINAGANHITSQVTGTGNFGTNTIHFDFIWTNTLGGAFIKFNGVR